MCTTHLLATGYTGPGMIEYLFILDFPARDVHSTPTWMNWPREAHSICTSTSAIACLDVPVRDAHSIYITSMHAWYIVLTVYSKLIPTYQLRIGTRVGHRYICDGIHPLLLIYCTHYT